MNITFGRNKHIAQNKTSKCFSEQHNYVILILKYDIKQTHFQHYKAHGEAPECIFTANLYKIQTLTMEVLIHGAEKTQGKNNFLLFLNKK